MYNEPAIQLGMNVTVNVTEVVRKFISSKFSAAPLYHKSYLLV